MSWLLTYILAGLQTQDDMNVYRKRRVFEKVFSAYNNPYLGSSLKEKILRLLFRGAMIEGGSTTLITRFSTMTWLQVQIALTGGVALKVLMEDILQRADKRRVNHWSSNGLESIVQEAVEY
jgi:nucleolar pre-ribosomal-associated protein 1